MPTTYITSDVELTSVADAIRSKTGGTSSLSYPTGFVSAINSITFQTYYTGTGTPSSSLGVNGDIYLKTT